MNTLNTLFGCFEQSKISMYSSYWNSITPQSDGEIFKRWLFAFTSIHSTWQSNVRCYNHIKNFEQWIDDKEKLSYLLYISKGGCHNQRTENIWDFREKYFENPDMFKKSGNESWVDMRNRLALFLKGIGLAKTSFALELCYPNQAEIVCLDVHMLRLLDMNTNGYRKESKRDIEAYNTGEKVWMDCSIKIKSSPYITRCLYWDINQGQNNSRYWSSCLEPQLSFEF